MSSRHEATLTASDGVPIHAVHLPGATDGDLALVVVHGFTNNTGRPRVQAVIERLHRFGAVVAIDMRGHGGSGGRTTLGDTEILDVSAGVRWARELGYSRVATVGFSMGGGVVVRQAALEVDRPDAVVAVSAPAFWYYRGTRPMRRLHRVVLNPVGRAGMRLMGVSVTDDSWVEPLPLSPSQAAGLLVDVPLLVVHGTADHYFPLEHPRALLRAARDGGNERAELWVIDGFGHAESGIDGPTLDAIGTWVLRQFARRGVAS